MQHWLMYPEEFILPQEQWPESVPKACVQVESDAEYFSIVQYLHKLGIVRPIAERTPRRLWSLKCCAEKRRCNCMKLPPLETLVGKRRKSRTNHAPHAFEFRRSTGIYNDGWAYVNWRGTITLKCSFVYEILLSLNSLPLAYTDPRISLDLRVTCLMRACQWVDYVYQLVPR